MDLSGYFNALTEKSKQSIKAEDGDYIGEDGLLYCGKCRTRKQGSYMMPFGEIRPYILCKCEAERKEAEESKKQMEERVRKLRRDGFPDAEMQTWTFAADDGANKITEIARRYADNFDELVKKGKGLLLFGGTGTGKTFAAACICNALIDRGIPCLMTSFSRLVNTISDLRGDEKQRYIDGLSKYALLAIDDIGAERDTEYMGEHVYNIVNARYTAGLPLIVTTNITAEELKRPQDTRKSRLYSRLFEMCVPIEVKGPDRRKTKLKDNYDEYKALLGL